MDNVNNLNGIPNFGHGWEESKDEEQGEEVIPTEEEEDSVDEVDLGAEAEVKPKKKK